MSILAVRSLRQGLSGQLLRPASRCFAGASGSPADPLKADDRTTGPQQVAHETDEATKDSIRHAATGEPGKAMGDIGEMAKNAARGAKESAKVMANSLKEKVKGAAGEATQDKP